MTARLDAVAALQRLLDEPAFAAAAERIGAGLRAADRVDRAADAVEGAARPAS